MMSSELEKMLKILSRNDKIEVTVSEQPSNYLEEQTQTINVFVAPKTPISGTEELKQILESIRSSVDIKTELKPSSGSYGPSTVCFEEILGKTTKTNVVVRLFLDAESAKREYQKDQANRVFESGVSLLSHHHD